MNPRTMWDGGMEAQTEDKPNQRADILRMVNSGSVVPNGKGIFSSFCIHQHGGLNTGPNAL
jgi:hypothetical protein